MRQLKPLTILAVGGLLTGVAMTVPFLVVERDARDFRGITIGFAVGAAFGLLMFAPIAFAEKFRVAIRAWFDRNRSRVQPPVAHVMALALGYWMASVRHQTFDEVAFISMGLLFIGALFGMVSAVVNCGPRGAE